MVVEAWHLSKEPRHWAKSIGECRNYVILNYFQLRVELIQTLMFKIHPETRNGLSFERTSQLMAIANQMSDHPRLVTKAI